MVDRADAPGQDEPVSGEAAGVRERRGLGARFWAVWSAGTVSSLGDGLATVALPLFAATLTRNPLAISGVLFATRLPWLLVAIPAGAYVDQVDRPQLMRRMDVFRTVLLAVATLLIAFHSLGLFLLYLFALMLGVCETVFDGAAQAILPSIVHRSQLESANGWLFAGETSTEQTVGPAIGGVLFSVAASVPFAVDAASFVGSAVLLRGAGRDVDLPAVRQDSSFSQSLRSLWTDAKAGVDWFRRSPPLCLVTGTVAVLAFCQAMISGLLVLYALEHLHLNGTGYGLFMGGAAVGNVAGGLLASRTVRWVGTAVVVTAAAVLAAVGYLGMAATASPYLAGGLLALEGVAVVVGNVATISYRQAVVPERLQGRIANVWRAVIYGSVPLGALGGGALASAFSLRATFWVAGGLQVALAAVTLVPLQRWVGVGTVAFGDA